MKRLTGIIFSIVISSLISGCGGGESVKAERSVSSPAKTFKAVILVEEYFNDGTNHPGYTFTEDLLTVEFVRCGIQPVSKNLAARSAEKTGINIDYSMNGLVDPVIKDYLLAELNLDLLVIGMITVKNSAGTDDAHCTAAIRGVSLKTGNVIADIRFSGVYTAENRRSLMRKITDDIINKGFSTKITEALRTEK